jgi:glycosyltransferase involved in cell wall biosynthesis
MEELALLYPDAPIECLWDDAPGRFEPGRVKETWLAKTPIRRNKVLALPLMPFVWRNRGNSDADWILCSSHLFAHHARFRGRARNAQKFVYLYTPARYIWTPELDKRGDSFVVRTIAPLLQLLDRRRAKEAHSIASISNFVKERVQNTWQLESTVIYPPVDVGLFDNKELPDLTDTEQSILNSLPDDFILGASRFIPYKRLDIVIRAGRASGIDVVIAGSGPLESELEEIAEGGKVRFIIKPSLPLLRELYRRCRVYIFPPVEDFGIMPVEAMATGTPVIASSTGGAAETVVDGKTGVLLSSFDDSSLIRAIADAEKFNPEDCRTQAWKFDKSIFESNVRNWIGE